MRPRAQSIEQVKQAIAELKGKTLSVAVNRGRKKIVRMHGTITDTFPAVFMFRAAAGDTVSFSYSDVICGDIKIIRNT